MSSNELEGYLRALHDFRTRYPEFDLTQAERFPYQRPFTERLLVGLIWGRPEIRQKDHAEELRLADAFKGLFGEGSAFKPQSRYQYDALLEIEQEYHSQRWEVERGTRKKIESFEKLAERFASKNSQSSYLRKHSKLFIESRLEYDFNMLLEFEDLQKLALEAVEMIVRQFGTRFFHYD